MSHDAWLEIDGETVVEIGNYTRNVSPMWRKAMAAVVLHPMAIQGTEGWSAWEATLIFRPAFEHMRDNPDEYTPLNPDNGWGNYEGAKEFVAKCLEACEEYPNAKVRWSV